MKNGIALAVTLLTLLTGLYAQSNKDYFTIEGIIQAQGGPVAQAEIIVSKSGKGKKTIVPKPDGKYSFELEFQSTYDLEFVLDGFATKTISVNTQVPKEALEDGIMPFFMDILLVPPFDGLKNEPATVSFNERDYAFRFDKPYMQTLKSQQKQIDMLKSGNDLELQANYDAAVKRGDGFFSTQSYDNAKTAYNDALKLKPSETYPKNKIAEIDKILAELALKEKNEKELNAKYEAAVVKGNNAFNSADYTSAKTAFTEANTLKPNEQYPVAKLDEINRILNEMALKDANEKDLKAKYDAAIKKGDDALAKQDLVTAKAGYNEALVLRPSESYPRTKLDEVAQLETAKANYDAAIQRGDLAFGNKDYANAKTAFQDALSLRSSEQYPKDKITEIDKLLGELALKEQNEQQRKAKYDDAINRGNSLFNSQDYTGSRSAFQEALTFGPGEAYPQTKITEIDKILSDLALKDANEKDLAAKYDAAIKKGDDALAKQDYATAKSGYNEALVLKPSESYPRTKLDEVARLETVKANYDAAIQRGDLAFGNKDYANAKTAFQDALSLRSSEQYPKDKITEIDKLLGELALKEQNEQQRKAKYDDAINRGNSLFTAQDYTNSKSAFQEALTFGPDEAYPKTKITEIDKILSDLALKDKNEKELAAKYDAAIKKGDDAFAKQDYATAKSGYNEALVLKPSEAYPRTKLDDIGRIEQELALKQANEKELKAKYDAAILKGDLAFKNKEYDNARTAYNDALAVKPGEQYPTDKIAEIGKIQAELALKEQNEQQRKAKYDDAINRGNALFTAQDYSNSKSAFQEALTFGPQEAYPKTKITEIDKILAEIALKEKNEKDLNAKYDAAIRKGDDAFAKQDYATAKAGYNEALTLKSAEKYPKDKVAEIDLILADIAQKDALARDQKAKYDDAVKRGDAALLRKDYAGAKLEYNDALTVKPNEQYPKDKIAEIDRTLSEIALKEQQEKDLKAKYDAAIQRGDLAFGNKDYTGAKTAFNEATGLKPAEKYPKDKIVEIDRILKEIADKEAKDKELNTKYAAALKKGDDALTAKDYTTAKAGYNEALVLKPDSQ